jgi:hypothetical protein
MDSKDYFTDTVRMQCIGPGFGVGFLYRRELPSNETGSAAAVRVAAGDSEIVLGREVKGERSAIANREFLQNAMAVPSIVITESFAQQGSAEALSRVIKLSTNGLSKPLEAVLKSCEGSNFLNGTGVKFLDGADPWGRR